jgi:hypothetical protein
MQIISITGKQSYHREWWVKHLDKMQTAWILEQTFKYVQGGERDLGCQRKLQIKPEEDIHFIHVLLKA